MKPIKPINLLGVGLSVMLTLASCSGSGIELEYTSPAPTAADSTATMPSMNVYVENSGSMDGYVAAGSTLGDAVYSYVSRLSELTDTTRLFYINSTTIPYTGKLDGFIGDLTPEAFRAAGGNRSSSDMAGMIERVLDATCDSTVTMFVSDCILDLGDTGGSTSSRLNNRRIAVSNAVRSALKRTPALGIVVLKMSSPFTGRYYYPDGRTTDLNGLDRPYYIWLAGNRADLARMLKEVPPISIVGNGFREMAGFTSAVEAPFSLTNTSLNGSRCSAVGGKYTFYLNADLSAALQPALALTDTASFATAGSVAGLKIVRVGAVTRENSPYNVFVELTLDADSRIDMDRITFNPPSLPAWVSDSDDEGISDVEGRADRTFGLSYLLTGVSEGFGNKGPLARFEFRVKR